MKPALTILLALATAAGAISRVSDPLAQHLTEVPANELVPVLITFERTVSLEEKLNLTDGLPKMQKRLVLEQELSRIYGESQKEALALLSQRETSGRAAGIKPLWIINAIIARADAGTIYDVAALPGVELVDWDEAVPVEMLEDIETGPQDEIVWGVDKIKAPQVWAAGYNGTGIVVAICDSGVNYNHLDLADHMWTHASYPNHGKNFSGGDPNDTMDYDSSGHGTHVAGTVASDGTAGSQCGVAPNATVMICKLGNWESSWFEAWQWLTTMGADVLQQSWSFKYPNNPNYKAHRQASETLLAAGICHANSTGNQGNDLTTYPIPFNIPAPANCPPPWLNPAQTLTGGLAGVVGVGSTNSSDYLANTSGRGPASWEKSLHPNIAPYDDYHYQPEMGLIKPDVCAPGVSIKSCLNTSNTGYHELSGTSMATPHVSGAVALLLDYNPNLSWRAIQRALEMTASDPWTQPGKENNWGAGRIDVYAALQFLINSVDVELKYFRATGAPGAVKLTWDVEAGDFAGFNLYREAPADVSGKARAKANAALITGQGPFAYVDEGLTDRSTYRYWLEAVPLVGKSQLFGPVTATAGGKSAFAFALEPAYPNPASAAATIAFSLPEGAGGDCTLAVYDLAGRKVRTLFAAAAKPGRKEVTWDLCNDAGVRVPPGVYVYTLSSDGGSAARKITVTK